MLLIGNTILVVSSVTVEPKWTMESSLLVILLNIGSLKTHGLINGEKVDILDLRGEILVVSLNLPVILLCELEIDFFI